MRDAMECPGYLAPVRQALVQPLLMGGAPRAFAILNGVIAVSIAFAGAPFIGTGIGLAGHVLGVLLARRDADIVEVLQRAMRLPDRLEI